MSEINFLPPWVETNEQPAFYDKESGTCLQQTARMYAKVNQLVRSVNEQNETIADYIQQFIDLKDYCEDYFDNLDVQQEINQKLDAMAENGTLTELIGNYVDPKLYSFQDQVNAEIELQNVTISNQNTAIDEIATRVNSVVGSNPIPVNSTDDMTDTTKIYVLTTNGYWYYYDGDSWEQGGLFQSAQDSNLLDEDVYLRDQMLGNVFSKNLLNQNSEYIIDGKYLSGSAFVNGNYKCSHPILVKAGVSYTFTTNTYMGGNKARYAYLNSDLGIISIYNATADDETSTATFTAPADGYITFNLYRNNSKAVFSKTADYNVALNYELKNLHLRISLENAKGKMGLEHLLYYSSSDNLFNKDSTYIIQGKFITASGLSDNANYSITHPIYFEVGDIVKYPFPQSLGTNYRYAQCNLDGTYISSTNAVVEDGIATASITASGYYYFNLGSGSYSDFMVVKNMAYPAEFIAYKSELDSVHIPYLDKALEDMPLTNSPIYGKKIGLTGDSICAGAGYNGGYGKILHDNYNMTVNNIGVGGGTITSGTTYSGSGNNRFWINESITSLDSDSDYVIVEGGVNDSGLSVELGAITNGYNDTLDTTTYYGAFENMCKQLITRFAGKKYAYLAVHQMTSNYRVTNSQATSYYWASKKCCEKWGVPFIDVNAEAPAFGFFTSSMGDLYTLRQNYTKDGDGWHPNEDGYKKYYIDKIVKKLEAI